MTGKNGKIGTYYKRYVQKIRKMTPVVMMGAKIRKIYPKIPESGLLNSSVNEQDSSFSFLYREISEIEGGFVYHSIEKQIKKSKFKKNLVPYYMKGI